MGRLSVVFAPFARLELTVVSLCHVIAWSMSGRREGGDKLLLIATFIMIIMIIMFIMFIMVIMVDVNVKQERGFKLLVIAT